MIDTMAEFSTNHGHDDKIDRNQLEVCIIINSIEHNSAERNNTGENINDRRKLEFNLGDRSKS